MNIKESSNCKGFQWIGQEWDHCDRCGAPYWQHTHMEHPAKGAGPFDDAWEYELISDESKAKVRARYARSDTPRP